MPTYNYVCKKCDHAFEKMQRNVDDPLSNCPECKEDELKKVFVAGSGGFQLKGKGWFKSGGY
jgi:putative FmdB family regulatory protein